jgi:hypothetical protein
VHKTTLLALLLWGCVDSGGGDADPEPDAAPALPDLSVLDAAPADADPPDGAPPDATPPPPDAAADALSPDAGPPCVDISPDAPLGIQPGEVVTGRLCPGRSGWYRLDIPPDQEATAVLTFRHADGDLELALYEPEDRGPSAESTSATDQEQVRAPARPEARGVDLRVHGFEDAGGEFQLIARLFSAEEATERRVDGTVTYADRPYGAEGFTGDRPQVPARFLVVEAVRVLDEVAVAETVTDADGAFELVWAAQPGEHRVRARAHVRVEGFEARVRGRDDGAVYAVDGPVAEDAPVALVAGAEDPVAGAFNIADITGDAFRAIAPHVPAPSPRLDYRWSPGQPFGCGSCYLGDLIHLGGGLEDTDEFDDVVILHEFGHYFVDHFSADDSPGGTHRDLVVAPELAYGEGLAYFFAGMVKRDPLIMDTFIDSVRSIDMEAVTLGGAPIDGATGTQDGTPSGWHREELVSGLMWDAFDDDSDAEPFDTLALGAAGSLDVLVRVFGGGLWRDVGPRGIDVSDWLNALTCEAGAAAVQPIADAREYPFTAREASCEKGRVPAPFELSERDGAVWLEATAALPTLQLRAGPPGALTRRTLECRGMCRLADADPKTVVVVSAPHQAWAGASWVGAEAGRALLGGRLSGDVRVYRSR